MQSNQTIDAWACPNARENYQEILKQLGQDNPDARNEFLSHVWEKSAPTLKERVSEAQNLPEDWNDKTASEDAKYAVQTYIQHHNAPRSSDITRQYYENGEKLLEDLKNANNVALDDHPIKELLSYICRLINGCDGCALTIDLIVDIMRRACTVLSEDPRDNDTIKALTELRDTLEQFLGRDSGRTAFAHGVPNLPQITTEVVKKLRTLTTQFRMELTSKDLDELIEAVYNGPFSPFQKPKLRGKILEVRNSQEFKDNNGIVAYKLRDALLPIVKPGEVSKIDQLLKSVVRTDDSKTHSVTIDGETAFNGRLAVFNTV